MSNNYFSDDKKKYENIEIPEELDFRVKKTLKEGRNKRKFKKIYSYGIGIASAFLIFVAIVNAFPTVAYAVSNVPGLNKLVDIIIFDKGFNNAVEQGLLQNINFEEEKNGITLRVNSVAGDWKRLWIDYEIIGEKTYDATIGIDCEGSVGIWSNVDKALLKEEGMDSDLGYIELGFSNFNEEFKIEFNIYDKDKEMESNLNNDFIATFTVPIKLNPELFNSELKVVDIDNNVINTQIGDIEISSLKTSKTRIVMEFNLKSELYKYMSFENPRFIDIKGNEYEMSSFFSTTEEGSESCFLELQGELKDNIKELYFAYDGIYYDEKDNKDIIVDLKNKSIEENNYNLEFISLVGDELVLKANGVESISFNYEDGKTGEEIFNNFGLSAITTEDDGNYVIATFKLNDKTLDKINLNVSWILKDKVDGGKIKLIEK